MPELRLPAEASALLRKVCAAHKSPVYLVGGAVRDLLLGRPVGDLDLATSGARGLARSLESSLNAKLVVLDEENAVYRLVLRQKRGDVKQLDLAEIQGKDIEADLARRDFTVNALACLVSQGRPGQVIDTRGGSKDLEKKLIRAESDELFKSDPLRLLRAFRLAAQLRFAIEPATLKLISGVRHRIGKPAAERVQSELMLLLAEPGCSTLLKVMDESGLLTALFPEMEPARKCAEVYYGEGGVLKHSLDAAARADFLLNNLNDVFPIQAARMPGAMPPPSLLILAALLHDVSKAETAKQVSGRLRFFGHDTVGAKRTAEIMKRLKFPRAHIDAVSAIVASHLRPGNLASSEEVTDKAAYRFFRDLGDHALGLLLVCWADHASYLPHERVVKALKTASLPPGERLGSVKPEADRKTVRHLQVVSFLVARLLDEPQKAAPVRILDGNEVMKALGIAAGPDVGKWLERLSEAQAVGRVKTRTEALAFLKKSRK